MNSRAVHWHEGMFLRPHHFNAAQQNWEQVVAQNAKWDLHYNWGLRSIELDGDALANYRLVIRSLRARLRDGTLISIPEDGVPPALDLKPAFERGQMVTAMLALPLFSPGRANAAAPGSPSDGIRYQVDTQELLDLTTGVNPQPIRVRRPNFRLLLSTDDDAGYETLPLARVTKSPRAEAAPELDVSYIPPLLSCDAWPPLHGEILQAVYDRVGRKIEALAGQIVSRGITFDSQAQGDPLLFEQLRELNKVYPLLGTLVFAQGVHPLLMYAEFCQVVGQLAIFGATRRPPELPRYDHDDLAGCFYRAKQQIDALLSILVEPAYKERPFVGAGLRMQVATEPTWLESVWEMYIGVRSPLDVDECIRLLTRPGELDMKVGSSDRVDTVFRMGQAGLRFTYSPHPPRALPSAPGLIYFQVTHEAHDAEWDHVRKSLSLAIRLNENLIVGNIQGQTTLTIKTGGQAATLQFTLYVVARDSSTPWVERG